MQWTLAYIPRLAIKAHHQPIPDGPLKQEELHHILIHAVLITHARYFSELKGQLIKTDGILRPATIAQLASFIDLLRVIRMGGRLCYASLDSYAKQPILLPKKFYLTQLIIRHFHQGILHAGPKLVLSMIRRKFWILSGRYADIIIYDIYIYIYIWIYHYLQRKQYVSRNITTLILVYDVYSRE
jgi:hypothetical protein